MEKVCKVCKVSKELDAFRVVRTGLYGRAGTCKACQYGHEPHKIPTIEKPCTICGEIKSIDSFSYINKERNYRQGACKKCRNKLKSIKRKNTPKETIRTRKKVLMRKYKLSIEEYESMLNIQKGKCKICDISIIKENGKVCVDHDHITGKVRGLLCSACNSMLGFSKDNIEILQKGIEYLNFYKK